MTRLIITSGTLYTRSGIPMHLSHAVARIARGLQPVAGDGKSVVFLDSGQVGLTNDSMGKLLNTKFKDGSVSDLSVKTHDNKIKISGKMKKVISLPVAIEGPLNVTPDGKLELRTTSMKTGKLPIKGLADALGMNVSHIVGSNAKGVSAGGDTLIFDPDELWGLPVHGHLVRVLIQQNGLVLIFGSSAPAANQHLASAR